jgi:hypothetical protein
MKEEIAKVMKSGRAISSIILLLKTRLLLKTPQLQIFQMTSYLAKELKKITIVVVLKIVTKKEEKVLITCII